MNSLLILLVICCNDWTATEAAEETGNNQDQDCLDNWTKIGSFCYKQLAQQLPYWQAVDKCWDEGAQLPVLKNDRDALLFYRFCKEHKLEPWLGLRGVNLTAENIEELIDENWLPQNYPNTSSSFEYMWFGKNEEYIANMSRPPTLFSKPELLGLVGRNPGVIIELNETTAAGSIGVKSVADNSSHPVVCQRDLEKQNLFNISENCSSCSNCSQTAVSEAESWIDFVSVLPQGQGTKISHATCKQFMLTYFADRIYSFSDPSASTKFPRFQVNSCKEFYVATFKRTWRLKWRPECCDDTCQRNLQDLRDGQND